jgi:hypothetical protein
MVRAIATVHFATAKAEIIYDSVSWGKKSGISPFFAARRETWTNI